MTAAAQTRSTGRLLLRSAMLPDGRVVDVRIRDGFIEEVSQADLTADAGLAPDSDLTPDADCAGTSLADEIVDLSGHLLLPAPAEPHTHLDKAYTAGVAANVAGDLGAAVAAWLRHRPSMTAADIAGRATRAIRSYVANGATAIRTHVDVGDDLGLRAVDAVLSCARDVAGLCDLQVVAFIGSPLAGLAGAAHRGLLRDALAAGAGVVGACPGRDPDPAGSIDVCLSIAADAGAPVDLHIDEGLEPEPCTLALLSDAVTGSGFPYPVAASHCVSLGMMADDVARALADRVAKAGVAVICLPPTNLYLQGRDHAVAPPRGLTALRTLRAAGVTVAAGGDNLQDPFNCLGRADPLEVAALLVLAGHDRPETAYASVASAARAALGLAAVQVGPGAPAELLAIRARSVRAAIAESPSDRVVIHTGRMVARTATTRRWYPESPTAGVGEPLLRSRR